MKMKKNVMKIKQHAVYATYIETISIEISAILK